MNILENLDTVAVEFEKISKKKDHFLEMASKQQKILDLCPQGKPDGTHIFTPESWIKWAMKELGY